MKLLSFSRMMLMTAGLFALSTFPSVASQSLHSLEAAPTAKNDDLKTSVAYDTFQTSKRKHSHSKDEFQFGDTKLAVNHELTKNATSFSSVDIGLRNINFGYKGVHPASHLYGTLGVQGGIITEDAWTWKGLARIEVPTKSFCLTNDSRYIFGFEGAYQLDKQWSLFLGMGVETGMRATNVQPIIGAQYIWNDWIFHAVYPNPRIIYTGLDKCQISLNIETFFTAVRAHRVAHHKKGVACFKGAGSELRVDYAFNEKVNGWITVGRVFNAKVTTGNKNFHQRHTRDINGPMYGQIGVSYAI